MNKNKMKKNSIETSPSLNFDTDRKRIADLGIMMPTYPIETVGTCCSIT